MCKKLRVDTARTAEPKEYPTPYGAVLSNKSWGNERGRGEVTICQLAVIPGNEALLSWEWPMGRNELISYFALPVPAALLYQTVFISSCKISHFCPSGYEWGKVSGRLCGV